MDSECNISLLEAIVLLEKSWRQVTSATIRNCFRHAGLSKDLEGKDSTVEEDDEEENLPISLWLKRHGIDVFPMDVIEQYECCDDEVCTSGTPTDDDIVSEIKQTNEGREDLLEENVEEENELSAPSIAEVKSAINVLNMFFSTENVDQKILHSLHIVDKKIDELYLKSNCVQSKITNFFHKK
nr:uncharacterized protein LOC122272046 [Parasteatoda tepidariorum]